MISKTIKHLENRGLVYRYIDENDKRSYCLELTEHGQDITNKSMEIQSETNQYIFKDFDNADI